MINTYLTYTDLILRTTYQERLAYLKLDTQIGSKTFSSLRELNQSFYKSLEWRQLRAFVISRDSGFDLAMAGYEIHGKVIVHHMNPITPEILVHKSFLVLDPNYLITVSHDTHNYIHFGRRVYKEPLIKRSPGDTKLW